MVGDLVTRAGEGTPDYPAYLTFDTDEGPKRHSVAKATNP
jgi:hypothetical protein